MQFIKQNLFFVVLVGVTVVLNVIGLCVISSGSSRNDTEQKLWENASDDLKKLNRSPFVNEGIVRNRKVMVKGIEVGVKDVRRFSVDENRRGYSILMLPLKNIEGEVERTVPAFPIDREVYEKHPARYVATEEYRKAVERLLASLRPTIEPTKEEIAAEQVSALARLSAEQERLAPADSAAPGTPGGPGGLPDMPGGPRRLRRPGGPGGLPDIPSGPGMPGGPGRDTSTDVTQKAQREGLLAARMNKAVAGTVYASGKSMDFYFVVERNNATDAELWMAQANLWIQGDIVQAIRRTNSQVLRSKGIDEKKGNVLNVPIKRLVSIAVDKNYVAASEGAEKRMGDGPGMPGMPGMRGMPGMPGRGGPRSSGTKSRDATLGVKESLTKNVSCKDFDVIRYEFTVVIPTRYVAMLMRNLYAKAYHKVLLIEMHQPTAEEMGDYYYGTDAVMHVTIRGEQLFLTDWSRGTWVGKAGREKAHWSRDFPALTPAAILQKLPSKALRKEDEKRFKKQRT